jgi:hypothetical protein
MFAKLFGSKEAVNTNTQPTSIATPPIPEGTTLEQISTELLGLMAQVSINHHRMGQLYNFMVEKRLAQKAGYKDAKDFFSQRLVNLSYATLTTYGAVAEHFSATAAHRFGVSCLSLLLTYAELTGLKLNSAEPGNTPIEVPDEKGHVQILPFSGCSADQLRRALQRKRKPTSSQPVPPEAEALADQLREVVKSRFPKGVKVQVQVRNQKGTAVLDFKGIPVEQLSQLAAALTGELSPVRLVEPGAQG